MTNMTRQHEELSRRAVFFILAALVFLTLVLLAPPDRYMGGRSFVEVASASRWHQWGDWLAAWCSLKIILLSLGVLVLMISLTILLVLWERVNLARLTMLSTVAPALGVLLGVYFLIKALL